MAQEIAIVQELTWKLQFKIYNHLPVSRNPIPPKLINLVGQPLFTCATTCCLITSDCDCRTGALEGTNSSIQKKVKLVLVCSSHIIAEFPAAAGLFLALSRCRVSGRTSWIFRPHLGRVGRGVEESGVHQVSVETKTW